MVIFQFMHALAIWLALTGDAGAGTLQRAPRIRNGPAGKREWSIRRAVAYAMRHFLLRFVIKVFSLILVKLYSIPFGEGLIVEIEKWKTAINFNLNTRINYDFLIREKRVNKFILDSEIRRKTN